jgi:hypothetical protein
VRDKLKSAPTAESAEKPLKNLGHSSPGRYKMEKYQKEDERLIQTLNHSCQFSVIIGIKNHKITIQFINKPILQKITKHLNPPLSFLLDLVTQLSDVFNS